MDDIKVIANFYLPYSANWIVIQKLVNFTCLHKLMKIITQELLVWTDVNAMSLSRNLHSIFSRQMWLVD